MEQENNKSELLLNTFYRLVAAILGQAADAETELRGIMSDNISGFGTGKHEIFNSREEFIEKIYRVFGKQLPQEAKLHFFDVRYVMLDTTGIVHGTYEINYTLDGVENKYYGRRSTVFLWDNHRWRAIHLHVSEPSAHLVEGESFPVAALKAQNEELKKQVDLKTEELSNSLKNLQATQQQLIQSAKMASLGELTAGIAHEIQNPLNFVNNFSDVNRELLAEMNEGIDKGHFSEVKTIAKDIAGNEEKINHHGKRADAIVKAMLQHSRSSSGLKEPTDINALADEYLRLSYHGLRAKDKSFNSTIKTDYDESIGKINVIPQDMGRVILNLINNAFYAVDEKKKAPQPPKGGVEYEPMVTISTKKEKDKVEIKVKDNGNGIPQKVLDKIFQPFFTTKPTGQGTGLGLSLSYDIVKAHGGELKVETKEGEWSVFIIQLPL
ncbi:MAG TPA: ATP-binding protein [Chitinophagaceae bacterium]|jgi:signal transduction histidine kinase|nr:ATP-binding protein [Chitinophagaceae bacterium]